MLAAGCFLANCSWLVTRVCWLFAVLAACWLLAGCLMVISYCRVALPTKVCFCQLLSGLLPACWRLTARARHAVAGCLMCWVFRIAGERSQAPAAGMLLLVLATCPLTGCWLLACWLLAGCLMAGYFALRSQAGSKHAAWSKHEAQVPSKQPTRACSA